MSALRKRDTAVIDASDRFRNAGVKTKPPILYDGTLFTYPDGTPRLSWDTWAHPEYWAERELVEVITRPIEDRALLNVYLQARALEHMDEYTKTLTAFEIRAFTLEKEALQKYPHITGWTRCEWIAERMGGFDGEWTPRRVAGLLENVSDIMQAAEMDRILELIEAEKLRSSKDFKSIVREVMTDEYAKAA